MIDCYWAQITAFVRTLQFLLFNLNAYFCDRFKFLNFLILFIMIGIPQIKRLLSCKPFTYFTYSTYICTKVSCSCVFSFCSWSKIHQLFYLPMYYINIIQNKQQIVIQINQLNYIFQGRIILFLIMKAKIKRTQSSIRYEQKRPNSSIAKYNHDNQGRQYKKLSSQTKLPSNNELSWSGPLNYKSQNNKNIEKHINKLIQLSNQKLHIVQLVKTKQKKNGSQKTIDQKNKEPVQQKKEQKITVSNKDQGQTDSKMKQQDKKIQNQEINNNNDQETSLNRAKSSDNNIEIKQMIQMSSNSQNQYFKNKVIKITPKQEKKNQQQVSSLWLGEVYDKCTSAAFKNFICHNLDYNEAKSYCCEQILTNIIIQIRKERRQKEKGQANKMCTSITTGSDLSSKTIRKKYNYETKIIKFINQQSDKILDYLCHKYPQTNISGVNKRVSKVIQQMDIDNWASDQYDLIRASKIRFNYKESKDYSSQIMNVLNFLISFPYQKHRKYEKITNFKFFQKVMTKIFSIVYTKQTPNDISKIVNNQGQFDIQDQKFISPDEQLIQYKRKVQQYTHFLIGSKISSLTQLYSQQALSSGIIQVDGNALARVIDKWAQELGLKFFDAQKHILKRTHRFKSNDGQKYYKIPLESKEALFNILCQKRKQLQQFMKQLKQSAYDLTYKLASSDNSDVTSLTFLPETQRIVGQFAVKMANSNSEYYVQILQKQINLLLQSIQLLKQQWLQKYKFKQSPFYQALKIDLITLKIGDLLRCKIISNQDQIIRILNIFRLLSQKFNGKLIKIIRVKNRLNLGTRDVLINFHFDQIFPCEIQLCVLQKISQKQQYFDKFNHFLYQLKRAFLGPLMEMSKIWSYYEGKSQTFVKQIQKSTRKKLKANKISSQLDILNIDKNLQIYQYRFPFICSLCQTFWPRNNLIYFSTLVAGKIFCGNCKKLRFKSIQKSLKIEKIQYIFQKYIIRYPNFEKLIRNMFEIRELNQLIKNKFQIHIPIHSRIIQMRFSMVLKLQSKYDSTDFDQYAFVSTYLTQQGQLKKEICSEKISKLKKGTSNKSLLSVEQIEQIFSEDYLMYSWSFPTKMVPLPQFTGNHYFELISNLLPSIHKLQYRKGRDKVKIGAIQVQQNRYYFIPFFLVDQVQITEQLVHQNNVENIKSCIKRKQQVLQLQNAHVTNQLQNLTYFQRKEISNLITEMYLPKNDIKTVDFIQQFHVLKIFDVSYNQIEQIPKIPKQLEQLRMAHNKIKRINSFIRQEEHKLYHLKQLDLSANGQIQKIQNIQNLSKLKQLFLIRGSIAKIEGLPSALDTLGLGFNKISKIQNLSHLKQLIKLNLAANEITKLQNLEQCKHLAMLMLNRNKIQKIQNLENLQNLTVLHLNATGLKCDLKRKDSQFILKGLQKIKRLLVEGIDNLIKDNNIVCLLHLMGIVNISPKTSINPLIQMQQIIASNNQISTIAKFQLGFPWIKVLAVNKNKLKQINNITSLTLLSDFNASDNIIMQLPTQGWQKLFKLKNLNLKSNKIRVMPNLGPLIFIKSINLQQNVIEQIHGFPGYPVGSPDFSRVILLNNNLLLSEQTTEQQFEITIESIKKLNLQSNVLMMKNGNCISKLDYINQVKDSYQLKKLQVEEVFI